MREWLGSMVTSGVVSVDAQSTRYHLPPEHAAYLTRAVAADNLAVFAQYVPLLGNVEDDIVECFKNGGGVSYERFPRFHAVMAEDSGLSVLSSLESHVLPLIPGLAEQPGRGVRGLTLPKNSMRAPAACGCSPSGPSPSPLLPEEGEGRRVTQS